MTELSGHTFEILWSDAELVLSRARRADSSDTLLTLTHVSDEPLPSTVAALEHAFRLGDRVDAELAARPRQLLHEGRRTTLVLDDPGGRILATLVEERPSIATCVAISAGIADALGALHARALLHKDVRPATILADVVTGRSWMTGLGLVSEMARERRAGGVTDVIVGTPAYMAPEQTGRMNRSIDSRSDLYALGVTLYELFTGHLPFAATGPLEWMHAHMARQPAPIDVRKGDVPPSVAAVIMKLLAKMPEDRYQTAAGLAADLRRCLVDTEAFALGEQDVSDRLVLPEKLYGRENEIHALLDSFERIVRSGGIELVLVSGYSGVGKSSFVGELHKALVPPRGLFASGKFDQYKRGIPYATLAQAFQGLVRQILGKSDAEVAVWRAAIAEALGVNGQLIVELIPEIGHIIGPQPELAALSAPETKKRFQQVLRRFIGVFARPEHPLALFLDDLQWLDAATLELLEDLVSSSDVSSLLLIGAYRDNEVDAAHPLVRAMTEMRRSGARVREFVLAPLTVDDVEALVADALHCERATARPLAVLLFEKTGGNPFFTIQFFSMLADAGLLTFQHETASWTWDVDRIRAQHYTDNVVVLMGAKLGKLDVRTQEVLARFACLGNAAELGTLAMVCGEEESTLDALLEPALDAGLVLQVGRTFTFLHDRVQEAAYALIPTDSRAAMHLAVGRLLAARITSGDVGESVFEVVNQLNRGSALIDDRGERESVARLNLLAGRRAKSSTAYVSALAYLAAGLAFLPADPWRHSRDLAFNLELDCAECEFITGEPLLSEARLERLASHADSVAERALVSCLQVTVYTALDRSDQAIGVCMRYLRSIGVDWPERPGAEMLQEEYADVWRRLNGRRIEDLVDLPHIASADARATIDVLTAVQPAALYIDKVLNGLIVCRMINLSLEHGNCDASCYAYVIFAMVLGPQFGAHDEGYRFGKLAFDLVETRGLDKFRARVLMCFGNIVSPWRQHARVGRPLVRRAFAAAQETGDLTFAVYSCHNLVTNLLVCGDPLEEVQRVAEGGFEFSRKANISLAVDFISGQLRLIMSLRGLLPTFGTFDDGTFREAAHEAHLAGNPSLSMATCWYWIRKMQARFHANAFADALAAGAVAETLLWTSPSFLEVCDFHFYAALTHAALHDAASEERRTEHRRALTRHHDELAHEARCCAANFENRAALVGAEIARLDGRTTDAMRLYELAIRSSREQGFIENEALAHELASGFYAAVGVESSARIYLERASDCYQRWGALGKVAQLTRRHPFLQEERAGAGRRPGAMLGQLDTTTAVKMSLAVSEEIVLERLVEKLMTLALEHAGAVRGLLLLAHADGLRVAAEATTGNDAVIVTLVAARATAEHPESIVRFVARSLESVILNDAITPNEFSSDPYVVRQRVRSALCLPLVKQGKLMGALYLENNLSAYVFTPPRIALLQLLASQAAISLENARLYADLRHSDASLAEAQRVSHTGSFAWSVTTGELAWSEETFHIFGYPLDLEPTLEMVLARVHPDDLGAVRDLFRTTQREEWKVEHRLTMPDGTVKHLRIMAHAAPGSGGTDYLGAVVDVTEAKRSDELLRARDLAEASNRAKDEFLANVSHEIRTPMNAILGMTELVLDTPLRSDQRQSLQTVKSAASNLLEIINDLLDFSKIEAGRFDLEIVGFPLRATLGETLRALGMRSHRKGLELICNVAPDVPDTLMGDPGRLRQVLLNLIGNAIKFTPSGEVIVAVRVAEWSSETRASLVFSVRDTGIGIPLSKQELVFEAFQQEDTSTTRKYGGTGLGLTIAARLVGLMGGKIELESAPGKGSEFSFTAWFGVDPDGRQPVARNRVLLRQLRVLVVDDNGVNRQILEEWLRGWQMRPTAVGGGLQALDALWHGVSSGDRYDLVLLDSRMPDTDGLALAEQIRERAELAKTKIILLTSGDLVGEIERLPALRIEAHLLKPVPQDELLDTIYSVIESADAQQLEVSPADGVDSTRVADPVAGRGALRILVAEDNEPNANLIRQLLGKHGHRVQIASTGRQAVDMAATGSFELLLLDLHMPELDGFGVVSAIRARERETGGHLPVVALTARARSEDRERCLAAGMDGFLVKPLRVDALHATIAGLVPHRQPGSGSDDGALLDREVLLSACGDDGAILASLLEALIPQLDSHVRRLGAFHRAGNVAELREAAHSLCGMVAVCSTRVSALASDLEDCAAGGETLRAGLLIGQLESAVAPLIEELRHVTLDGLRA